MEYERLTLIHVTPDEMQLIQAYRHMVPECQRLLINMAVASSSATAKEKPENVAYLSPVKTG